MIEPFLRKVIQKTYVEIAGYSVDPSSGYWPSVRIKDPANLQYLCKTVSFFGKRYR